MTLAAIKGWKTKQLELFQSFPQALVERELYMRIPYGVDIGKGNRKDYVLKIHQSIYGKKQAGRV